jgi:hypothetical protein
MASRKQDPDALPLFEKMPVHGSTVKITKAGDGLSAALDVQPVAMHIGDTAYYVLRTVVRQVTHKETNDARILRQHTVEVVAISEIDAELADKTLRIAAEELQRARAEKDGQLMMEAEDEAKAKEATD